MQGSPSLQGIINRASHWFFKCTKHMQCVVPNRFSRGKRSQHNMIKTIHQCRAQQTLLFGRSELSKLGTANPKHLARAGQALWQIHHHRWASNATHCALEIVEQFSSLLHIDVWRRHYAKSISITNLQLEAEYCPNRNISASSPLLALWDLINYWFVPSDLI